MNPVLSVIDKALSADPLTLALCCHLDSEMSLRVFPHSERTNGLDNVTV